MTMEQLDVLRGYGIAAVILAFFAIGLASNLIPPKLPKLKSIIIAAAGFLGGIGGLGVFFLFNFISGWDQYFASKASAEPVEYTGRHQTAAKIIKTLGEMDVSLLGIVFGLLGILLLAVAAIQVKSKLKT